MKKITLLMVLLVGTPHLKAQDCAVPANLAVSEVTSATCTLSWDAVTTGNEVQFYQITIQPGNAVPQPGPTTVTLSAPSYEALTPATTYSAYVRSFCSGAWSDWSSPSVFTTAACDAVAPVPYDQDFEAVVLPGIPACNTAVAGPAGSNWTTVNEPGFGFTDSTLTYTSATEAADAWYFTQGIQLEAGSFYKISYKFGNNGTTTESFTSGIATGPAAASVTGTLATHDAVTGGTLTAFTFPNAFSVPQSGVFYLAFHATSAAGQGTLYLDDIKVEAWTCDEPTGIAAGSITQTGATLTWTAPVNSVTQGYFYAYSTTNTPPENFQMSTGAAVTLDGLAPGTTYYFFVKSFCGPTLGEWSEPVEFTTAGEAAGVTQNTAGGLTVYPNPAAGSVTLHNTTVIEKAMVYNLTGQLVLSQAFNTQDGTLDITRLSAGAYLLSVYSGGGVKQLKIIKL